MITEDKLTEIVCIPDDFCKEFDVEMEKNSLPSTSEAPKRRRKRMMLDANHHTDLFPLQYLSKFQALLLGLCLWTLEKFVSSNFFIQSLCGDNAALFRSYDNVPQTGMLRGMHGHQFHRQHLHSGNSQQTPVQYEGIQGNRGKRQKHNGVVCWFQATSAVQ